MAHLDEVTKRAASLSCTTCSACWASSCVVSSTSSEPSFCCSAASGPSACTCNFGDHSSHSVSVSTRQCLQHDSVTVGVSSSASQRWTLIMHYAHAWQHVNSCLWHHAKQQKNHFKVTYELASGPTCCCAHRCAQHAASACHAMHSKKGC